MQFISNQKWALQTSWHQWIGAAGVVTSAHHKICSLLPFPCQKYDLLHMYLHHYSKRKLNQESYIVVSTGSRGFNFFCFSGNFGTLPIVHVGPYYTYCKVEFNAFGADASPLKLALGVWSDDNSWFWNTCLVNIPFDICIMVTEFQHINKE